MQGNSSLPPGNLDKHFGEGVLFVTYSLLISGSAKGAGGATKVAGVSARCDSEKGDAALPDRAVAAEWQWRPPYCKAALHSLPKDSVCPPILNWHSGQQHQGIRILCAHLTHGGYYKGVTEEENLYAQVFDEAHKAKNLINLKGELLYSLHMLGYVSQNSHILPDNHAFGLAKGFTADHGNSMPKGIQEPVSSCSHSAARIPERHCCCSGDADGRPGRRWSSCSWCCRGPRSSTPRTTGASEPTNLVCALWAQLAAHDCPMWAACLARKPHPHQLHNEELLARASCVMGMTLSCRPHQHGQPCRLATGRAHHGLRFAC